MLRWTSCLCCDEKHVRVTIKVRSCYGKYILRVAFKNPLSVAIKVTCCHGSPVHTAMKVLFVLRWKYCPYCDESPVHTAMKGRFVLRWKSCSWCAESLVYVAMKVLFVLQWKSCLCCNESPAYVAMKVPHIIITSRTANTMSLPMGIPHTAHARQKNVTRKCNPANYIPSGKHFLSMFEIFDQGQLSS